MYYFIQFVLVLVEEPKTRLVLTLVEVLDLRQVIDKTDLGCGQAVPDISRPKIGFGQAKQSLTTIDLDQTEFGHHWPDLKTIANFRN